MFDDDKKKLAKLIHGIKIAMLTTADTDGCLRSRPMATQSQEFDGDLWFFTGRSSHKLVEIDADHHVNLAYGDASGNRYVSVSGNARLVEDKAKIKELWNPALKAWFPKGLEDPELCLLKVSPNKAEYWDAPGAVVQVLEMAKAIVKGEHAKIGDHGQLDMSKK